MIECFMLDFIVACITPNPIEDMIKFLSFLKENGVKKALLYGSTGEGIGLFPQDYKKMLDLASKVDMEYIIGISNPNPEKVLEIMQVCDQYNIAGYMLSPPFTIKAKQQDIIKYFSYFKDKPVIIYNNIWRFGVDIEFDTYSKILQNGNIIGIKECSKIDNDIWSKLSLLIKNQYPTVKLYAGDDENWFRLAHLKDVEISGCISVLGNIVPDIGVSLAEEFTPDILEKWMKWCEIFNIASNPQHIKYLLSKKNLISDKVFLSYNDLTDKQKALLDAFLD